MIRSHPRKPRNRAVLYSLLAVGTLATGVRDIHGVTSTGGMWFDVLWGSFAVLTIGANLWFVLGVDREREMLSRAARPLSVEDSHDVSVAGERMARG